MARRLSPRAIAVLLFGAACAGPGAGKTAFVGAELFDGTGSPIIHDAVIIVADGRIEAIGTPDLVSVPRGAEEVRLDGRWVIPGLIDANTHVERWALTRYLAYGVTSVRDADGVQDSILFLRTDIETGMILGPRLYISGAAIDGARSGLRGATTVRTSADARRAVGNRVLIDATQIKIGPKIDRRLLQPLLDEAGALQTPVTAHLGKVDALTAARAGVAVIEHLSGVVEATVSNPARLYAAHDDYYGGWNRVAGSWQGVDSTGLHRTARALVETRVMLIPTLAAHDAWAHLTDPDYQAARDLTGVPDSIRQAWDLSGLAARTGISTSEFAAFRRGRRAQDRFVRLFRREGGRLAAGSNSPGPLLAPGASLHLEIALLAAAGLTPEEALLAATREAAHLLRADSIGVLRQGGVADFVVLSGNPLEDISNTRNIEFVVSHGVRYDPADLMRR